MARLDEPGTISTLLSGERVRELAQGEKRASAGEVMFLATMLRIEARGRMIAELRGEMQRRDRGESSN